MSSTAPATVNTVVLEAPNITPLKIPPLSLPPEAVFDSYEKLFKAIQQHAKEALYAFIISKSDRRKGRIIRIISCQRGGASVQTASYRSGRSQLSTRKGNTTKTGCLFSIKARERIDGTWTISYREEEKYQSHNHPPAEHYSAFSTHRQLNSKQLEIVQTHQSLGVVASRTIVALQKLDPTLTIVCRDIYNINARINRINRQGRSPSEALIADLEAQKSAGKVHFSYEKDSQGHITLLFIATVSSVQYLNENAEVILLDCTYKTNKFGMPLLHIMGVDGLNQTFTVAICFLDQETEEYYNKAVLQLRQLLNPNIYPSVLATDCEIALISALERHFPIIRTKVVLCFWHILKNVTLHCKAKFETQERWEAFLKGFCDVVKAKTEDEFEDILEEWKADFHWNNGVPYTAQSPLATAQEVQELADFNLERQALAYCIGQWLNKYKTKVVHAWVDRYFHAGARTTSRLEGGHHTLKGWIRNSTGDLSHVWQATKLAIEIELTQIRHKRARELQSIPIPLSSQFYYAVKGHITHFGLYKLREQYSIYQRQEEDLADRSSTICTGNFFSSFGVPCWHTIKAKLANGDIIQPLDFHPFYHYYRPPPGAAPIVFAPSILDPTNRQRRRSEETERRAHTRQYNRLRTAESGRILSQFEQAIQPLRHCSACIAYRHDRNTCRGCQATGHTRSNCPNRPVDQIHTPIQASNIEGSDSFWSSQTLQNRTYITDSQLQQEEFVPATQDSLEFEGQLQQFY